MTAVLVSRSPTNTPKSRDGFSSVTDRTCAFDGAPRNSAITNNAATSALRIRSGTREVVGERLNV